MAVGGAHAATTFLGVSAGHSLREWKKDREIEREVNEWSSECCSCLELTWKVFVWLVLLPTF